MSHSSSARACVRSAVSAWCVVVCEWWSVGAPACVSSAGMIPASRGGWAVARAAMRTLRRSIGTLLSRRHGSDRPRRCCVARGTRVSVFACCFGIIPLPLHAHVVSKQASVFVSLMSSRVWVCVFGGLVLTRRRLGDGHAAPERENARDAYSRRAGAFTTGLIAVMAKLALAAPRRSVPAPTSETTSETTGGRRPPA